MNLKTVCLLMLLLLCVGCVSRTITEPSGLTEAGRPNTVKKTKLIWIWDKEFHNP